MSPFSRFHKWYNRQLETSALDIPSAGCLSTVGTDGFPNARFVSLKEVKDDAFIVTGPLISRKGIEIKANPKVALTFWWPEIKRQVRIQGEAQELSAEDADKYFRERDRKSCIVSWSSRQGEILQDVSALEEAYNEAAHQFRDQPVPRPGNWGGFIIRPVRIEFLKFKKSRFHQRVLYTRNGDNWEMQLLQP